MDRRDEDAANRRQRRGKDSDRLQLFRAVVLVKLLAGRRYRFADGGCDILEPHLPELSPDWVLEQMKTFGLVN
jgi:hypothetical protein